MEWVLYQRSVLNEVEMHVLRQGSSSGKCPSGQDVSMWRWRDGSLCGDVRQCYRMWVIILLLLQTLAISGLHQISGWCFKAVLYENCESQRFSIWQWEVNGVLHQQRLSICVTTICPIRKKLTKDWLKKIVFAFVLSLDWISRSHCTELYVGKFKRAQTSAKWLIPGCYSTDHSSPLIVDRHWLPIYQRNTFSYVWWCPLASPWQTVHSSKSQNYWSGTTPWAT